MKTIVIGDIHGRTTWKEIVKQESDADKIIFVGDYFDSFFHTQAECLKNYQEIIEFKKANPNQVVLLIGNHDFHYIPTGNDARCSGYNGALAPIIETLFVEHIAEKLVQMAYLQDNFLFTHAGVTKTWFKTHFTKAKGESVADTLNAYFYNGVYKHFKFQHKLHCSMYGDDIFQGCIWVRPDSLVADRLDKFIQIVGHTGTMIVAAFDNEQVITVDCLEEGRYLRIVDGEYEDVQLDSFKNK